MVPDGAPSWLVFLCSVFLVGIGLYLVGVAIDDYWLRMLTKPLPVLALMAWTARAAPDRVGRAGLVGLGLGLGGDMLLEASAATFLPGLISFMLGHIAYIVCFSWGARRLAPLQAVPMLGYTAAAAVILVPALEDLAIPVVIYMVVISLMAWRAAAYAEAIGRWAWAAPVGALLFLFSDTLIAVDRFVEPIDGIRPAIILTYWLGQAGIAAGIVLTTGARAATASPAASAAG